METSRIFVKQLPPNINEADFRRHFSAKGNVTDIKLIPQRRFGYVGYRSPEEAATAVKYFNRSFIRMSRLSVELAKPIADPSLARKQSNIQVEAPWPERKEDAIGKKRKREAEDESDPKLQEYLGVMQATKNSASKVHDISSHVAEEHPTKTAPLPGDAESEDEYQKIPRRKRAPCPVARQEYSDRPKEGTTSTSNTTPGGPIVVPEVASEATTRDAPEDADGAAARDTGTATDDDWLRSRTNRLLDLVDDEDIVMKEAPESGTKREQQQEPEPHKIELDAEHEIIKEVERKPDAPNEDTTVESMRKTSRLFIRNLAYGTTEEDVRRHFQRFGDLAEVLVPTTKEGNKGFAFISFTEPKSAVKCFLECDGRPFQGRVIHILAGSAKRDTIDDIALSNLPLKQQNLIKKKTKAATSKFNWNSLYMNQDAVNTSLASRLNILKSELLDPTNADAAVKQAIAETSILQDTKAYFTANGVDLNAFKSEQRGDMAILVKNFPHGTTVEDIRSLFEVHGQVLKVLMPPSGTIAIVLFLQASEAKAAFAKLAYSRFKTSMLFLEKAPKNLFYAAEGQQSSAFTGSEGAQKLSASELLEGSDQDDVETSSLFVKNLSFATSTPQLAEAFQHLDGFKSARVKTKTDSKKPGQVLSMGFGFVDFSSKDCAEAALKTMDGQVLHGHKLQVKSSHRGNDAAEDRRREDKAKKAAGQRTKIVIKNLPFECTKTDLRQLFGAYGQLRTVRIPKNMSNRSKGFAFCEFTTVREAENAYNSLRDTHLLGRKLVLEFAEAETVDAEEEIIKMQKKVGGQMNKVALQQLTGAGRKRVTLGEEDDEGEI